VVDDDAQTADPAINVSLPAEMMDKGQILALRLVLRHD